MKARLLFFLLSPVFCFAQLSNRVNLKPADYTPQTLVQELERQGYSLNYSSSALKNTAFTISQNDNDLIEILHLAFNTDKYDFEIRNKKILIIPRPAKGFKTYSGFVEENISRERLIGVNISIPDLRIGTTTNSFGYYSLSVPAEDTLDLIVSSIGYENQHIKLYPRLQSQFDILMKPHSTQLEEVVVSDKILTSEKNQMSEIELSPALAKSLPPLMGEVDIIRVMQMLPGVQSTGEASTGILVRGGSPDQNLILLDGVPVYNVSHLFGFFSVFNADAIKSVSLTKGGFPARYGGRLSSVISIDMKEGNMQKYHGTIGIGLLSSRITLEGPIKKDKTSFMLSGRRTYLDALLKPIFRNNIGVGYYFGDLNAKVNHIFNRHNRLYLSYYWGNDKLSFDPYYSETDFALRWGNNTASLRYNHLFSNRLFGNLTATYSNYTFSTSYLSTIADGFQYLSNIRDYGLKYDLEFQPALRHKLRFGASYTFHNFKPGLAKIINVEEKDSIINFSYPVQSHDLIFYAEDEWDINEKWKANIGLHYSQYYLSKTFYHSLQPRMSVRHMLAPRWSLKASYAEMAQYIHLLSNSGIGLPTDLWVSSTSNIAPQYSRQIAVGGFHNSFDRQWELSLELYYKWMSNLIAYKEGENALTANNWENLVENDGKGQAYGGEVMIQKTSGNTTGWIGYTLAWSNRQFSNINDGKTFPFRYDRRHDISIVLNHKFSPKFDIGANWVYGTGIAFTAPLAEYYLTNPEGKPELFTEYSDRNSQRLSPYHRMDIGFNFHKQKKWGRRTWNISLYNAYNRQNPYFLYVSTTANKKTLKEMSLLPVLPSISYIYSF